MRANWTIFAVLAAAILLGVAAVSFSDAGGTILVGVLTTAAVVGSIRYFIRDDADKITGLFFAALAARLAFGLFVHIYDLREFFGGDALTYDANGTILTEYWSGLRLANDAAVIRASATSGPSWGMFYLTGFIYTLVGKNILAAQTFCGVIGAATVPAIYYCSVRLFNNRSVGWFAAMAVAFFPAFVIWSSQLLKDGLIVFLLVLTMIMVLRLLEKFSYSAFVILLLSMGGIISLRFYIFYMLAMAVGGSFIVGISNSAASIVRRTLVLVLMGIGLTYLGVIRNATVDFEKYATLENLQRSRTDQASSESGYGEDLDVSTTEGAIVALPIGLAYLLLAPFPWQVSNFRQAITVPEVLVWWSLLPFAVAGIAYAIRHRLRSAFPVLLFTLLLTLAYSIFQGNVGTAHRQRTQIQVFLFIFIAVGWTIYQERRNDRRSVSRRPAGVI